MLYNDKPCQNKNESLIQSRTLYSERLGSLLKDYSDPSNLIVSVMGPWGSGKTSIVNMALKQVNPDWELEKTVRSSNKNTNLPIIVKFNPWNYTNQTQLIQQFFGKISSVLGKVDNTKKAKEIAEKLDFYRKAFKTASLIPIPGLKETIAVTDGVFNSVGESLKDFVKASNEDLEKKKSEINKLLSKYSRKIIVVIDDIDRLNKKEICMTFQLVKSLADFDNLVYLLSFDKNIVLKALEETHSDFGDGYLEKIVQIPLYIPLLQEKDLEKIFLDGIGKIIKHFQISSEEWAENYRHYFSSLYNSGGFSLFKNIRQLKRFLNLVTFTGDFSVKELNFVDYLYITSIQVKYPDLYEAIYKNKYLFLYQNPMSFSMKDQTKEEQQNSVEAILDKSIKALDTDDAKDKVRASLKIVFPKINYIYLPTNRRFSESEISDDTVERKICSPKIFDRYFTLYLPEEEFSSEEIQRIFFTGQKIDLETVGHILSSSRRDAFFDSLSTLINTSTKNLDYSDLLRVWLMTGDNFLKERSMDFFGSMQEEISFRNITDVLMNKVANNSENLFEILKQSFTLSTNIEVLFDAYFVLKRSKEGEPVSATKNEMIVLGKILVEKVRLLVQEETLFNTVHPIRTLLNLQHVDEKSVSEMIEGFFESEKMASEFLDGLIAKGKSFNSRKAVYTEKLSEIYVKRFFGSISEFQDFLKRKETLKNDEIKKICNKILSLPIEKDS